MTIVILDDSKTVLLTIAALLEELGVPHQSIWMFLDGHEALEYIKNNGADIIFSDINMDTMDGFEFVEKLFELSENFVASLFIVSGDETSKDINKMRSMGVRRFIRKPIDIKYFKHSMTPEIQKRLPKANSPLGTNLEVESEVTGEPLEGIGKIDYEALAQKIGVKVKRIPMLLASFMEESNLIIVQLQDAIKENLIKDIERYSHSLKGSAGNMQFFELATLCKAMEMAAQEENVMFDYHTQGNLVEEELKHIHSLCQSSS